MNLEDYNVEITTTPEDVKFTERCEAAGLPLVVISMYKPALKRLVADEREKVAQWMIQQGYATGHGDTVEDLLKELEWQIAENWTNALVKGVEGEREACAKVCELIGQGGIGDIGDDTTVLCAKAIRARSEK